MKFLKDFIIILISISILSPATYAGKRDKRKKKKKPKIENISSIKYNIVPRITGGIVTGEAANAVQGDNGNINDKVLFGIGFSIEYFTRTKSAIGLNFDIAYKDIPQNNASGIYAYTYSASWILRLTSIKRSIPYLRTELGLTSGKVPNQKKDFGRNPTFRIGLGIFNLNSKVTNTRFELYYKKVFTSDQLRKSFSLYSIDYHITYFGIEFGLGFSL